MILPDISYIRSIDQSHNKSITTTNNKTKKKPQRQTPHTINKTKKNLIATIFYIKHIKYKLTLLKNAYPKQSLFNQHNINLYLY